MDKKIGNIFPNADKPQFIPVKDNISRDSNAQPTLRVQMTRPSMANIIDREYSTVCIDGHEAEA